jgi:hypothetical protein
MAEERVKRVREFADRGIIDLLGSPRNLAELVRIVATDLAALLDFARAERVNRSFIEEALQKEETDVIYRIPFRDEDRWVWVYLLVEHQSRPDRTMGFRLLSAMVELWRTQVRGWEDERTPPRRRRLYPVIPVVLYTGKRRWRTPVSVSALMDLTELIEAYVPAFESLILKVNETPAEALGSSGLAGVLRGFQGLYGSQAEMVSALEGALSVLSGLTARERAEWRRALDVLVSMVLHGRSAGERDVLFALMRSSQDPSRRGEAEEAIMTGAEAYKAEGRTEGRAGEARRILLRWGAMQLGEPEARVKQAIESIASVDALEALLDRLKGVESWDRLLEGELPT